MFPGGWKRCDNCWNHNRLLQLDARLRRAVEACRAALPKESCDECPTCDTRWDDMTVTHEAGCKLCAVIAENADLMKGASP